MDKLRDTLVTVEIAELAISKGFDRTELQELIIIPNDEGMNIEYMPGVTQSLLQKWLRDHKGILLQIYLNPISSSCGWVYTILRFEDGKCTYNGYGSTSVNWTYEEALEQGLIESLNLL